MKKMQTKAGKWRTDELSSRTISSAAQNVSRIRADLLQLLGQSVGRSMAFEELVTELDAYSEKSLAEALYQGVADGLIDLDDDRVSLTTVGQRATSALY